MIPDINLIPRNLEKEESGSKLFYILLTVLFLVVLAFMLWQYFSTRMDITALKNEEATLQQQRNDLQQQLESLKSTQTGSLEQSVQFVEAVSYPVTPIIDELQKLQPEKAYFRKYSFSEESVTIVFDIETLNEVSEFVSRLNASSYFSDIQVTKVDQFILEEEPENAPKFNEVPRQSAEITLFIDKVYLATGGVQ